MDISLIWDNVILDCDANFSEVVNFYSKICYTSALANDTELNFYCTGIKPWRDPVYELAIFAPTSREKKELYKLCMDSGEDGTATHSTKFWMAYGTYVVESYNLKEYQDAYDCWLSIKPILEKIDIKNVYLN